MMTRYLFKMGFFSEQRHEFKEALKSVNMHAHIHTHTHTYSLSLSQQFSAPLLTEQSHYRLAYKNVRELPITAARLAELKAVGGLINAKVCA